MISTLGARMTESLPAKILLEALLMLGCLSKKVPNVTACPRQEDYSNAHVNKDEGALKVWQTGE